MPRLLKFSCQNCGVKLAVPLSMAGMTDHCPKCNSLVTSPIPGSADVSVPPPVKVEAPPPQVSAPAPVQPPPQARREVQAQIPPQTEGWSTRDLQDAFNPAPAVVQAPQPKPVVPAPTRHEGQPAASDWRNELPVKKEQPPRTDWPEAPSQPSLAKVEVPAQPPVPAASPIRNEERSLPPTAPVSTPPQAHEGHIEPPQTAPATVDEDKSLPSSSEPAKEEPVSRSILSSMLNTPSLKPRHTVATTTPRAGNTVIDPSPTQSQVEPLAPASKAPLLDIPPNDGESEEQEHDQERPMPGMGEILAAINSAPNLNSSREAQPWLTAPFLTVTESSKQERRQKKRRMLMLGLVSFILVDVGVAAYVFRRPLAEWLHRDTPIVETTDNTPPPTTPAQPIDPSIPSVPELSSPPSTKPETKGASPEKVPSAIPIPESSQAPAPTPVTPAPVMGANTPAAPVVSGVPTPPSSPVPTTPEAAGAQPPPPMQTASLTTLPAPEVGGLPPPPADMALPNGAPPTLPVEPAPPIVVETARRIGRVPAEAKPALDALLKFLDSVTWQERAKLCQKSESLQGLMQEHAAKYGDGPISVGNVEFVERYTHTDSSPYCMFEVNGGTLKHGVLALVEQPKSGACLVDWEGFMEFRHDYLLKFLQANNSPPKKFRVMLRRAHYFDKDVPDITGKDGFQISQPNATYDGHVFIPKGTPLSQKVATQLGWDMNMPVILELGWKTQGKNSWVEILSIPSYGWRS